MAKATGPAKFFDGHARVSLFEEANDLLIGKSGLFHSRYSPKLADFVPSLWYDREGGSQGTIRVNLFIIYINNTVHMMKLALSMFLLLTAQGCSSIGVAFNQTSNSADYNPLTLPSVD